MQSKNKDLTKGIFILMRRILSYFLTLLERWLDDSVDPEKLQAFLKKYAALKIKLPITSGSPDVAALPGPKFEFLDTDTQFLNILAICQTDSSNIKGKMESLLRHIEVRRKGCFKTPGTPHLRVWQKRHRAALLLCAFARQEKDLRYLNAALKLNDWSFRHYQGMFHRKGLPLYITALQEQEAAIQELLP